MRKRGLKQSNDAGGNITLAVERNSQLSAGDNEITSDGSTYRCFEVLYGKVSTRMHKKWQGDGVLFVRGRYVNLQFEDSSESVSGNGYPLKQLNDLKPGSRLVVSGYELEIQSERIGVEPGIQHCDTTESNDQVVKKLEDKVIANNGGVWREFIPPLAPMRRENDLILEQIQCENGEKMDVVVESRIAQQLRPHQKDGIAFLYAQLKNADGGAILADEMGLGKTVQTISLISALMRRGFKQLPLIRNCFIIVPTSLVKNWYVEFAKWMPRLLTSIVMVSKSNDVSKIVAVPSFGQIVLISYELALRSAEKLSEYTFDLLVCDEAHRLKNMNGRLRQKLRSLKVRRCLLLTGTPIQNDLEEFFSLIDLARPNLFGSFTEFKDSLKTEPEDFNKLLSGMMLRRTAEVNYDSLPQKTDYIFWCKTSQMQCAIYKKMKHLLTHDHLCLVDILRKLCNHPSILYQSMVARLRTCKDEDKDFYKAVIDSFPDDYDHNSLLLSDSGKLIVFMELMSSFHEISEKVIVVSNFTKTLDMLEELCKSLCYNIYRLDGTVEAKKRLLIVDEFNLKSTVNSVLLLSAKSGGVGLNLIGASCLVLFDSDWNPAIDLQAMARIWRQGQTNPCHIFRLVTAGTVDEKILQRQIKKSSLTSVIDPSCLSEATTHFSDEELQDIFCLLEDVECNTHDMLECECDGCGLLPDEIEAELEIEDSLVDDEAPDDEFEGCLNQSLNPADDVTSAESCDIKTNDVEIVLSTSTMMAAMMRWRHYSPRHREQFQLLKSQARLSNCSLSDICFAMKLTSNY